MTLVHIIIIPILEMKRLRLEKISLVKDPQLIIGKTNKQPGISSHIFFLAPQANKIYSPDEFYSWPFLPQGLEINGQRY